MIIECEGCKARFRLDRKRIDGYRAVRVRCRKCGSPIFVMAPQPLSAASLPYRTERQRGTREIPSAATAQPLVEEEFVEEATPDNLVDLRRFREAYRKRMPPGAYDISGDISTEIPYPELPFAAPGPEAQGNEASREPATGCYNILEEVFLLNEGNRPRRSAALSILKVMLLITAVGTAFGYLAYLGFSLLLPVYPGS